MLSARTARLVSLVALGSYLVAWFGVMPSPRWLGLRASRITAESYPCQGGSCACVSADSCWTTCSCQSVREKVRWARRIGAPIPEHIDVAALDRDRGAQACPLCPEGGAVAGATAEDEPSWPVVSPMGCGVLTSMLALGIAPVLLPTAEFVMLASVPDPRPEAGAERAHDRTLEAPTPPPRARS